jgi:hypothetical protein
MAHTLQACSICRDDPSLSFSGPFPLISDRRRKIRLNSDLRSEFGCAKIMLCGVSIKYWDRTEVRLYRQSLAFSPSYTYCQDVWSEFLYTSIASLSECISRLSTPVEVWSNHWQVPYQQCPDNQRELRISLASVGIIAGAFGGTHLSRCVRRHIH